jgi:AraC-like DNA-binding protein
LLRAFAILVPFDEVHEHEDEETTDVVWADMPPVGSVVEFGVFLGRAELTEELRCSRRHLTSRFREQIGLPPKAFARILRFDKASAACATKARRASRRSLAIAATRTRPTSTGISVAPPERRPSSSWRACCRPAAVSPAPDPAGQLRPRRRAPPARSVLGETVTKEER